MLSGCLYRRIRQIHPGVFSARLSEESAIGAVPASNFQDILVIHLREWHEEWNMPFRPVSEVPVLLVKLRGAHFRLNKMASARLGIPEGSYILLEVEIVLNRHVRPRFQMLSN